MNKSFILFSSFKRDIFTLVFPDGMAEQRVPLFRNFVVNGLIQMTTYCESYQLANVGFYDKDASFDDCGLSVIQACRGQIGAVYAFKPSCRCQRYFYDSASLEKLSCLYEECRCAQTGCTPRSWFSLSSYARDPYYCGVNVDGNAGCKPPYLAHEPEDDCAFKTANRYFAVGPGNKVWLSPRYPCGYLVAVHWRGIRRAWLDTDYVLDDEDLKDAIAAYVESEVARRVDKDQVSADKLYADYRLKAGDIIFREERDLKPRATRICVDGLDMSELVQIYPSNPYPVYFGDQCAEKATTPVTVAPPPPAPTTYHSAQQVVTCANNSTLTANVALPSYLSISGPSLILAAGYASSTVSQMTADASAFAVLQNYFTAGLASGNLQCGMPTFLSASQSKTCSTGDLILLAGSLAAGYSITDATLTLAAGHSVGASQAAADAAALAELTNYFNNGIASGLLACVTNAATPTSCGTWWKADSLSLPDNTQIGEPGNEWLDSTGHGRNLTQSVAASRPRFRTNIFGTRPAVQFDGIDDFLNIGLSIGQALNFTSQFGSPSQQCTIFMLFKQAAAVNNAPILIEGTSDCMILSKGADNTMYAWDGQGTIVTSTGLTTLPTDPRLIIFRNKCFSANQMFRENKTNKGLFTQSNLGFDFTKVGGGRSNYSGGPNIFFGGYIAEIIAYCSTFTDGECDAFYDGYWKPKYPVLP